LENIVLIENETEVEAENWEATMSKLDELIKELCPNGVEYKKISDFSKVLRGKNLTKDKLSKLSDENPIPVYQGGIEPLGYYHKANRPANMVMVINVGSAGTVAYSDIEFWASDKCFCIDRRENVDDRYLYHFMKNNEHYFRSRVRRTGSPTLDTFIVDDFKIPLPPLEIQHEIVRILDTFTGLIAELKTELTARKKQYEYYRDKLLKPKADIPMVKLKEIATSIYRGSGITRDQVTEYGIPCVRYEEIYTTYHTCFDECVSHTKEEYVTSPKYFEHGDLLFAITGESVDNIAKSIVYVGYDKCLAGGDIVVMKHEQNPRYLAHVLNTSMAREQKSKGMVKSKVAHSDVSSIQQIEIPLPPLDVQNRYAEVLDNFDKICNDLNIDLPAEIDARQKQYEFYREQLLTFAETGKTILTDRQSLIKLLQYVFGYAVVRLNDISENFDNLRKPVTSGARVKGDVPYYGASGIVDYVKDYIFDGDYLLVSEDGANLKARVTPIAFSISGKTWVNNHAHVLRFEKYATRRFVEMYLNSIDLSSYITGAVQLKLNKRNLNKIEIPLPSLEEQERIVAILDRFDPLRNSSSEGLPAEIEARQKQYEYYRDKLLTFKEKQ
jgi:type I restriction enzyme S subunit